MFTDTLYDRTTLCAYRNISGVIQATKLKVFFSLLFSLIASNANGEEPGRILTVTVSATASVDLPRNSAVFIYAKAIDGPRAPLAVRRLKLNQLPMTIKLDESMSIMPSMSLADFDLVQVIARATASSKVTPNKGDYEVKSGILDLSQKNSPLKIEIANPISFKISRAYSQ